MLHLRRGLVPACLTLGVLLSALPALADTLAKPVVQASTPQTIVLQHIVPADVVKMMHWELASKLPAGVTQIVSVPLQNALLVTATPAGLAKVREIVKIVDITPRQVQIKFATALVSTADLKSLEVNSDMVPLTASDLKQGFVQYTSGSGAAQFLQTLDRKRAVTEGPDITTTNNVEASMTFSAAGLPANAQQIRVTPRVNSDNSVTLDLHATFSESAEKHEVSTLRTVKSGEMLLFVMPPASIGDKNLLLFVTPTVK